MTAKHNITLAIEPNLLKKARAVSARRGRSVSALLADELRELVAEDARYSNGAQTRSCRTLLAPVARGNSSSTR